MRKKSLVWKANLPIEDATSFGRGASFGQFDVTDIGRALRLALFLDHNLGSWGRLIGHFLDFVTAGRQGLWRRGLQDGILRFLDTFLVDAHLSTERDPAGLFDHADPVLSAAFYQWLASGINLPGHLAVGGIAQASRIT